MSRLSTMNRAGAGAGLCGLLMLLGACTSPAPERFNPATQARIRVYHGASAELTIHHGCGQTQTIHAAAGDLSFLTPNKTLGMPRPASMFSHSFHEYALPAGKPVTVRMVYQWQASAGLPNSPTRWLRCGPLQSTFIPQPGQDYETFLRGPAWFSTTCQGLEIRRLVTHADGRVDVDIDDVLLAATTKLTDCPTPTTP